MVIAFTDANMYATSMAQRNVLKATVPDRSVWLPTPACVIAAVRFSKALNDAHSKEPSNLHVRAAASKTPVIKNINHLNTLHLHPAKTNKERFNEFLYQSVELSTSDCSIFTEN